MALLHRSTAQTQLGDADTYTIPVAVPSNATIVVRALAWRYSPGSHVILNTPTSSPSNTWSLAKTEEATNATSGHLLAAYVWHVLASAASASAGACTVTLPVATSDGGTFVTWWVELHDDITGIDSSACQSAETVDPATSLALPSSGTLGQAANLILGVAGGPYCYGFNGGGSTAPSGWTFDDEVTGGLAGNMVSGQAFSRVTTVDDAVACAFGFADGYQAVVGAYAVYETGTATNRRVRIANFESGYVPVSGDLTSAQFRVWPADPISAGGELVTSGITLDGDDLLVVLPTPGNWTDGQVVNCHFRHVGNARASVDFLRGVVEDF